MDLFYVLLVLLVATRLCAELSVRLKQSPLVGELVAGVLLGVVVREFQGSLPNLEELNDSKVFHAIADLGVFFLMLLGGLELRAKDLRKASGVAVVVAVVAMALPLGAGTWLAWVSFPASDLRTAQALFVGTALAVTGVPVTIRVLMDLGRLEGRIGSIVVSAAVFDDILSLLLLSFLTAFLKTGGLPEAGALLALVGKVALFLGIVVSAGLFFLPRLGRWTERFRLPELEFSLLVIVALSGAALAEALGMHFILGAFAAGLFFDEGVVDAQAFESVKEKVAAITEGFLAPIFFASIGMSLDVRALTEIPGFVALLLLVAFATKLLGAAVPGKLLGLSWRQSAALGVAMTARGAVMLIIAGIALRAGLFEEPAPLPPVIEHLFSAMVVVAVVTTLAVPIGLRLLLGAEPPEQVGEEQPQGQTG